MGAGAKWLARGVAALMAALAASGPGPAAAEAVETALGIARDAPARLVMAYSPDRGWIVRQDGRQVEIAFPGADLAIQLPPVPGGPEAFRSLSAEVRDGATYLRIGLGCDCTLAIRSDGRRLEIDAVGAELVAGPIRREAGPAPRLAPLPPRRPAVPGPGAEGAVAAAPAAGRSGRTPQADPAPDPDAVSAPAPDPGAIPGGASAPGPGHAGQPDTGSAAPPPVAPSGDPGNGPPPDLDATRDRLLGELRQAAESGFITLRAGSDLAAGALPAGGTAVAALVPDQARQDAPAQPLHEAGGAAQGPGAHPAAQRAGPYSGEPATDAPPPGAPRPAAADPGGGAAHAGEGLPQAGAPGPEGEPPVTAQAAGAAQGTVRDAVAGAPTGSAEPACLPNEAFLLPDPQEPGDLVREIAALRRGLTGEFDRPDHVAVARLARLYIANGLGAEASSLLGAMGAEVEDRAVLAALAVLSEDRPLPAGNVLAAPGCTGQHALWQAFDAALAGRNAEALAYEAAATGALEQAARAVRGRIASRIGLVAAAAGDRAAAHRLLAMARRGVTAGDRSGHLMVQRLAAEDDRLFGKPEDRVAKLETLSRDRSETGAEALLALASEFDGHDSGAIRHADQARLDRMRLDLGALALAARGSARGEAALLAEVRLTAGSLGRDAAFAVLEHGHRDGTVSEPAYRAALSALAELAAAPGDTELALVFEAAPHRFAASLAERGFRQALARSYAGLGAPALAGSVLRDGDLEDAAVAASLAWAFLDAGEPDRAGDLAALLPDAVARAEIAAEAARQAGDPAAALTALAQARAPASRRAAAAWSIPDWDAALAALRDTQAERGGGAAARAGDLRTAARLAFAALQAGAGEVPAEARALLQPDPAMTAGLEALFVRPPEGAQADPSAIPGFLARMKEETRLLEALLDDG